MKCIGAATLAVCFVASAAHAGVLDDPAAQFGSREDVEQISLSPDGRRVAFVTPMQGQGAALFVAPVGDGAQPAMVAKADGNPNRLGTCGWVSDNRLVCSIYMQVKTGMTLGFSRLIAVDADGKNMKEVTARDSLRAERISQYGGSIIDWLPGEDGAVLIDRDYVPEVSLGTTISNSRNGLGVDRIDTRSLSRRRVEQPRQDATQYITDGRGTVRIMGMQATTGGGVYAAGTLNFLYRTRDGNDWRSLSTYNILNNSGFLPEAVDPDLNVVYGFDDLNGRRALYKIALDGSLTRELVFASDQVDVDGLIQIGRAHRVVGVTYATDKRNAIFFDPALKALAANLSKALPGKPVVGFVDASADEGRLLLWAGSDVDPGRYYLFDKQKHALSEVLSVRSPLESVQLAPMIPVTYKSADGTDIPAYLTMPTGSAGKKNIPAIVMPHGGPSARDEWGFDWLTQYFANRGFAVLQPNFRGSSGYGEAWFKDNGFKSWKVAVGDVNDAGRWLVSQGIADPSKLAIFGWSYGGYAALQSQVLDPGLYKAVVAVAPVTDLSALRNESRDFTNFHIVDQFIGEGPHVVEGSPVNNAGRFKAPVLLFHGEEDMNVRAQESREMAEKLRGAGKSEELVIYPGLDHQLQDSAIRTDMLRKVDAFLRQSMHM